jgi:hypothetical protein
MVNNSTNINNANNNLSPQESLNSDGQQLTFFRGEIIVYFVDIGGIVDHHCLNFL